MLRPRPGDEQYLHRNPNDERMIFRIRFRRPFFHQRRRRESEDEQGGHHPAEEITQRRSVPIHRQLRWMPNPVIPHARGERFEPEHKNQRQHRG